MLVKIAFMTEVSKILEEFKFILSEVEYNAIEHIKLIKNLRVCRTLYDCFK